MSISKTIISDKNMRDYYDGAYPLKDSKFYRNYKASTTGNNDSNQVIVKHPLFGAEDYLQIINIKMNTKLYYLDGTITFTVGATNYVITFNNFQAFEIQNAVSEMNRQCTAQGADIIKFESYFYTDSATKQVSKMIQYNFDENETAVTLTFTGNVVQQLLNYDYKFLTNNSNNYTLDLSTTNAAFEPPIYKIDYIQVKSSQLEGGVATIDETGNVMFGADTLLVITKDDMEYENKTLDYQFKINSTGPILIQFFDQYNRPFNFSFIIMQIEFFNKEFFRDEVINESEEVILNQNGEKIIQKNKVIKSNQQKLHQKKQCFVKLNSLNTKVFLQDYYKMYSIQDASGNIQYKDDIDSSINTSTNESNDEIYIVINYFNPIQYYYKHINNNEKLRVVQRQLLTDENQLLFTKVNFTAFFEEPDEFQKIVIRTTKSKIIQKLESIQINVYNPETSTSELKNLFEIQPVYTGSVDDSEVDYLNYKFFQNDNIYYLISIIDRKANTVNYIQNIFKFDLDYIKDIYLSSETKAELIIDIKNQSGDNHDISALLNDNVDENDVLANYITIAPKNTIFQNGVEGFFTKYAVNLCNILMSIRCNELILGNSDKIIYEILQNQQTVNGQIVGNLITTHNALTNTDVDETTIDDEIFYDTSIQYLYVNTSINTRQTISFGNNCFINDEIKFTAQISQYVPTLNFSQFLTLQMFVNNTNNLNSQMGLLRITELQKSELARQSLAFSQTAQILFIDVEGDTKFKKMNNDYWTWKGLNDKNYLDFNCFLQFYNLNAFQYVRNFDTWYKLNVILRIFLK